MVFQTVGNKENPAVLFFHAMGVTGESSRPVAEYLKAYPHGHFPVFQNSNHMQYQIKDPKGFAEMLDTIVTRGALPELPFLSA